MKIKYKVTMDDLVAFNIFHHRNSALMKRNKMITGVAIPACIFLILCITGIAEHSWEPVIIGLIICILLMLWNFMTWEKRIGKISRKFMKEGQETSIGIFDLEMTADNITEKGQHKEATWLWNSIDKIGNTPEHIFAYTSTTSAIVIPHAGLIEGSYAEFLAELIQFFEKKVNVNESQEHDLTDKIIIDSKTTCHTDTRIGKQSGLGIASLVISLLVGGMFFMVFLGLVIAAICDLDTSEPISVAIGTILLLGIAANMAGLGFGIAGLFNKNRKKLLSVLGIVFNGIILAVLTMLVAFGMVFG